MQEMYVFSIQLVLLNTLETHSKVNKNDKTLDISKLHSVKVDFGANILT